MPAPDEPPENKPPVPGDEPPAAPKEVQSNKGDFLALGIGCLVLVIFFVAIVLVGLTRE